MMTKTTMYKAIKTTILILIISVAVFGQNVDDQFFEDTDVFMKKYVKEGLVDYATLQGNMDILPLINTIENVDLSNTDEMTKKAFNINAYNLHVINLALNEYPLQSVQDIPGFFEKKKVKIAGKKYSLNSFEKENLLQTYSDPRLHFVLVCGAVDCPPITNFAYHPSKLEEQLEQQTRKALNDPTFIKADGNNTKLSQIFKWYKNDFGDGKNEVIQFINKYRESAISDNTSYYSYDWTLNDTQLKKNDSTSNGLGVGAGNNASRYVVSSIIPNGSYEIKIFNNLYSQKTRSDRKLTDRSSFFTTTLTALYGLSKVNVGINTRWRKVRNHLLPSSPFGVFGSDENGSSRSGLTGFGPMIRWAPVQKWDNFSIQSSYTFAIGDDLKGKNENPFIDWNGGVWNTQFFNDFPLGDNFSLFTEIDIIWEDLGKDIQSEGIYFDNKTSTPLTAILSYFPTPKITLYTLFGYAPSWALENESGESGLTIGDYFYQAGIGAKYQFKTNFEVELLYSDFTTKFLNDFEGQAATYNLGFRINI